MIIRPDDSLEKLVAAGILPQWIADDAEPHGMDKAEYILNEFDWEWGWDLGDGYNDEQWEVLNEVRRKIQEGIKEYYAHPDLVEADREMERRKKECAKRREELKKTYCSSYVALDNLNWLMAYEEKYKSLPIFHFICFRSLLPSRSDLQKAILKRIGATCDEPLAVESIQRLYPEMSAKTVRGLAYHNWPLFQKYKTMVEEAVAALPSPIPSEDDAYWTELIESQRLEELGMTPSRLRRLMTFFSLNKKTPAQKRKGSAGIY